MGETDLGQEKSGKQKPGSVEISQMQKHKPGRGRKMEVPKKQLETRGTTSEYRVQM